MHTFGNRRDIDGLRALAVISVVLFHYGFGAFSGGFVGVDVFFVISGFLITSIIHREITAGRFSFIDFWARRARRIIPALSVVLAATLLVGWLLLTPNDYSQLGRAVRYQAIFISNILFMRQDGYFNPASDFKPLLHTWSLSVEEQYYIVFPLLMVLNHALLSALATDATGPAAGLVLPEYLEHESLAGLGVLPAADACLGIAVRRDVGGKARFPLQTAALGPSSHKPGRIGCHRDCRRRV